MSVTEETGTMEFETEAVGGIQKAFIITVKSYEPFRYGYVPVE